MVLVDTSVWIEVFRRSSKLKLDKLVEFDEIVTCLPVIQEVLQGFRDERAFQTAREAMHALPVVESPMGRAGLRRSARVVPGGSEGRAVYPIGSGLPDCGMRDQERPHRTASRPRLRPPVENLSPRQPRRLTVRQATSCPSRSNPRSSACRRCSTCRCC